MMLPFVLIALACAFFLVGGYLVGARRAVDARDALRRDVTTARSESAVATATVARLEESLEKSLADVHDHTLALGRAQSELERLKATSRSDTNQQEQHRRDLEALRNRLALTEADLAAAHAEQRRADLAAAQAQGDLRRLLQQATQRNDAAAAELREAERALTPIFERERTVQAIEHIQMGAGTRGELPRLLDAIARAGGLRALVLSDDSGLPLASNEGAERAEVLAAVWSQVLVLGDRVAANSEPPPVAMRVLDAHGRVIVLRVITAGRQRFVLVAVAHGEGLSADALEPAVPKLEQVLVRDAWQT